MAPTHSKRPEQPPPSYVPRTTFDMTELLPVLANITLSESNSQTSPLFKLPAELRNKIFRYALGGHEMRLDPEKRKFTMQRSDSSSWPVAVKGFLNLTLVCRQIWVETAMLPFSSNTFVFTPDSEMCQKGMAQLLLPAQINAITTVKCLPETVFFEFHRGPVVSRHCLRTFMGLEGLERLVVAVGDVGMSDKDKEYVVEKLREMHGKKELAVVASTEVLPC